MYLPVSRIDSRLCLSIANRYRGQQRSNHFYRGQAAGRGQMTSSSPSWWGQGQRSSSASPSPSSDVVCLRNVQHRSVKLLISRQLISTTLSDMNDKKDEVKKEGDKSATKTDDAPSSTEEDEKPIKFSASPAYKGKTLTGRGARLDLTPNLKDVRMYEPRFYHFQDFVVILSIVAFLAWFGIFREENDIDEELGKPLYKRVPAMEQQVLEDMIAVGRFKGEDVSKYEERLAEVKKELNRQMSRKK